MKLTLPLFLKNIKPKGWILLIVIALVVLALASFFTAPVQKLLAERLSTEQIQDIENVTGGIIDLEKYVKSEAGDDNQGDKAPTDSPDEDSTDNDSDPDTPVSNDDNDSQDPVTEPEPTPQEPVVTPDPETPTEPAPVTKNWWDYPAEILPVTKSGDDLLVLVNKKYQLSSSYVPGGITAISNIDARIKGTQNIRAIIMDDLRALATAAKAEGLDLSIVSSYRSYQTQVSTYQYWVNYNGGGAAGIAAADTVSARPGHSQHQLGTAIDFSTGSVGDSVGSAFNTTPEAIWLANNAWKYGFVISYPAGHEATTGYAYEGWHYRYIGVANAAEWKASGEILEVWLGGR